MISNVRCIAYDQDEVGLMASCGCRLVGYVTEHAAYHISYVHTYMIIGLYQYILPCKLPSLERGSNFLANSWDSNCPRLPSRSLGVCCLWDCIQALRPTPSPQSTMHGDLAYKLVSQPLISPPYWDPLKVFHRLSTLNVLNPSPIFRHTRRRSFGQSCAKCGTWTKMYRVSSRHLSHRLRVSILQLNLPSPATC